MITATGCRFCGHEQRQDCSDYCEKCEHSRWRDKTKLTLDVLRREDVLGEPDRETRYSFMWDIEPRLPLLVVEWDKMFATGCLVCGVPADFLGQLRRILSVIQETPGGGDAAK